MVRWLNAHLTIEIPEEEYQRIKKYPDIKWGAIARKAMIQYLNKMEKFLEEANKPDQSIETAKNNENSQSKS